MSESEKLPSIPVEKNPPQGQAPPRPLIQEETIFDGPPSWMGRFSAFVFTWIVALLLIVIPIVLQVAGVVVPWWGFALGILFALVVVLAQFGYHRTISYRITNYRIDFERGLLTRRIDSLVLWHADDLHFKQTLLERMLGVGSMEVVSDDKSNPRLQLKSIPNARAIFEKLKTCILNAKRQRGLLQLDQ